jgi:hypothetical protein
LTIQHTMFPRRYSRLCRIAGPHTAFYAVDTQVPIFTRLWTRFIDSRLFGMPDLLFFHTRLEYFYSSAIPCFRPSHSGLLANSVDAVD